VQNIRLAAFAAAEFNETSSSRQTHQVVKFSRRIWHSEDRASWCIPIIKPTRCTKLLNLFLSWNSTCFGQFLCPSSGVYHCTHSNRYMSYRLCWLLASRIRMELVFQQAVNITCTTYTYCYVYSARLLMMGRETVRNM
jgi:hypothetical protein